DHAVVPEVVRRSEEARAITEVELSADDPGAHRAGLRAEACTAVVQVAGAARIRGHPGTDIPIRARRRRRHEERGRDDRNESEPYTSHSCTSSVRRCKRQSKRALPNSGSSPRDATNPKIEI